MIFNKEYINPIDAIYSVGWPSRPWISYDPNFDRSDKTQMFFRCKQTAHDGTLMFTYEAIQELLLPIINMKSIHTKSYNSVKKEFASVHYTLSPIRHASVYGVRVNDVVKNGMRERFRVYVRCNYLDDNGNTI